MKLKYTSTTEYGLSRGSERAAAFDLRADKDYQFGGFDRVSSRIIGTGISVAIPDGHVGLVTLAGWPNGVRLLRCDGGAECRRCNRLRWLQGQCRMQRFGTS